jgi:hypothetical protein
MNDHIFTAWSVGVIGTLAVSAIAAELWRSRERWRNEAEYLRGRCAELHAEVLSMRELWRNQADKERRLAAELHTKNANLHEELKRRAK